MAQTEDSLIKLSSHTDIKRNFEYIKFGVHQSLITVLNTASAHLDKILIFQLLGAPQTAIYFIAISIPDKFRSIIKQFESSIFARFAKHTLKAVQQRILSRFVTALAIIVPIYLIYLLIAPFVFNIFLPQYENAVYLSQIYAITLFAGALVIPQSALKAHASSKDLYFNSIFIIITKPLFVFVGIHYLGLQGAIVGATVALILYTIVNLITSIRLKHVTN